MNRILTNATLVLLLGSMSSLIQAQSGPAINPAGQRLEGVFLVTVTPESGAPAYKIIRLFLPNGSVVGPGPSALASTACGEWLRTGDREFAITIVSFNYSTAGPALSITTSRGTVRLNETADQLSGRFVSDTVDLDGNLLASITASVQGQRIQVQTLPMT
jgi:hypothetical protein